MNSNTTTIPPARWFTQPDRDRIAANAARVSRLAGPFKNMPPAPEGEGDALRAGLNTASIQIGTQQADISNLRQHARAEYVRGLNEAADRFAAAALIADDDTARWAARLVVELRDQAAKVAAAVVPDAVPSLPEVPGVGKEADRG